MISAKVLAKSVNPNGVAITSFLLTYPRFIHSEFMTHRCFSRNAASSRAIPFPKMMENTLREVALPEYWGGEKKGMQSGEALTGDDLRFVKTQWFAALNNAMLGARMTSARGLHKSLANRLIEPFSHITVLATATEAGLGNFFALRAHPAAQPEFQVLAYRMLKAYLETSAETLNWGEWHMPDFGRAIDEYEDVETSLKIATARCARLSYLTFDGDHSPEKDIELHDKLADSGHWSPFEHCAQAAQYGVTNYRWSNFDFKEASGWQQYRKQFNNECAKLDEDDLREVLATKPEWITL